MGLEASCPGRWPGGEGEVKALLEAHALILRGGLRRPWPIAALSQVRVEGEVLRLSADGEPLDLFLGAVQAARWARKIQTPPPSLAQKLGVGPQARVLLLGAPSDPALIQAVEGARATDAAQAALCLTEVEDSEALARALDAHAALAPYTPLWVAYRKGPGAAFGEGAVRAALRARGYADVKVCAVSSERSATRFHHRVGGEGHTPA